MRTICLTSISFIQHPYTRNSVSSSPKNGIKTAFPIASTDGSEVSVRINIYRIISFHKEPLFSVRRQHVGQLRLSGIIHGHQAPSRSVSTYIHTQQSAKCQYVSLITAILGEVFQPPPTKVVIEFETEQRCQLSTSPLAFLDHP